MSADHQKLDCHPAPSPSLPRVQKDDWSIHIQGWFLSSCYEGLIRQRLHTCAMTICVDNCLLVLLTSLMKEQLFHKTLRWSNGARWKILPRSVFGIYHPPLVLPDHQHHQHHLLSNPFNVEHILWQMIHVYQIRAISCSNWKDYNQMGITINPKLIRVPKHPSGFSDVYCSCWATPKTTQLCLWSICHLLGPALVVVVGNYQLLAALLPRQLPGRRIRRFFNPCCHGCLGIQNSGEGRCYFSDDSD